MSLGTALRGLLGGDPPPDPTDHRLPRETVELALRLLQQRGPRDEAELDALRALSSPEALRAALMAPGAPSVQAAAAPYAAPLWLLAPPASPRIPWRLEPPCLSHPVSQICTAGQMEGPDYAGWCASFGEAPRQHRKQWEFCWILAVLQAAGMLRPGVRALGFGTGREPIPSVLAAQGVEVLATDAPPDLDGTQGWDSTGQHAAGLMALHHPAILDEATFRARVSFRPVDMNAIPSDLAGFDACWSSCCFEHLGGIEAGLNFVENSLRTLRPGGVAVHTTEFNLGSNEETLESPGLSLFRRRDIESLLDRLAGKGHRLWPLNLHPGDAPVDAHVDAPPYALPHLKILAAEHITTSIGLVVQRAEAL
ncbi:SAM-dependent methyltransferase [Muricoccus radiodurans]|uniref:SAM-dependent methyltransferase n=1 Tax=Muricoccus radiodurans TaxID=2231721 RepID=UPI003CF9DBD6